MPLTRELQNLQPILLRPTSQDKHVCGHHKCGCGQIQLILGPMFSGKTTELIRRLKRYQIAQYKCLIVKYAHDQRYDTDGNLSTHDREGLPAVPAVTLAPLHTEALKYDVVGIDEGQFFPDVVEFCEGLANMGKTVIVAALDGTYQRQGFGSILGLVPLSESVIKLTAVCMVCCSEASYTQRIGDEQELEVIGGADKYLAVCRSCYHKGDKPTEKVSPSVLETMESRENFTHNTGNITSSSIISE